VRHRAGERVSDRAIKVCALTSNFWWGNKSNVNYRAVPNMRPPFESAGRFDRTSRRVPILRKDD
jgi:hypothetical protein